MKIHRRKSWIVILLLVVCPNLRPQPQSTFTNTDSATAILSQWISLDAPPGWEHLATDRLSKVLTGWQRDRAGNLMLSKGSGSPRRVIACPIDSGSFAVTQITDEGYLRLREMGSLRAHPLWNQFHEGQRVRVLTGNASVPGVVAVRSTHLQRGRAAGSVATIEDLWVDVGARSRSEVEQAGVTMLNPVVRDFPAWSFANFVAGPQARIRVGCAAVASAARGEVEKGETIFLLTTLASFGNDGLEAALRKLGHFDQLYFVDGAAAIGSNNNPGLLQLMIQNPSFLPESAGIKAAFAISPEAKFAGSLVEAVDVRDAEKFLMSVGKLAGLTAKSREALRWLSPGTASPKMGAVDRFTAVAGLLGTLADVPGVSGHEQEIRQAILASLSPSLRAQAITDQDGNLILEVGPARDPVMFIAHQDEVGFEITGIATDGGVTLRPRGGLYGSLWEGQPALLHFDVSSQDSPRPPMPGVFLPRKTGDAKQPDAVIAWFGLDGKDLESQGVRVGQAVTGFKRATRLGTTRFTARGLDDRSGTTALILAARRINPQLLKRRVIFAWSVREETGLEGARVLAKKYADSVNRVYSVDTFVSSDSPLESTRFAFAPLGKGAVIRGLDSASVSSSPEIERVLSIARRQRIPIQVGATNGGADGSEFVRYGVPHVGLSWPGRYSHSPVEVLDLRDLVALERLVHALATAP
jgi:putative aminopeptidase FrvX